MSVEFDANKVTIQVRELLERLQKIMNLNLLKHLFTRLNNRKVCKPLGFAAIIDETCTCERLPLAKSHAQCVHDCTFLWAFITLSPSWSCSPFPITVMSANICCPWHQTIISSSLSLVTMSWNGVKSRWPHRDKGIVSCHQRCRSVTSWAIYRFIPVVLSKMK